MTKPQRVEPGPGQESVWDYPRPPRVTRERRRVRVDLGGERIVDTDDVVIVRETAGAPVFFIARKDVAPGALRRNERSSMCEWKGRARYFDVEAGGRRARDGAFEYPSPAPGFEAIRERVALYAGPMDRVLVDGEPAEPQPGGFYAGWVLPWVAGPIKGEPGTLHW